MTSVELDFDEKSIAGAMFVADVAREIRRAAAEEKAARKVTQQAIAEKVGTSRAVINREMSGVENMTARRIAEILWALGWEPRFEARKVQVLGQNDIKLEKPLESKSSGEGELDLPPRTLVTEPA